MSFAFAARFALAAVTVIAGCASGASGAGAPAPTSPGSATNPAGGATSPRSDAAVAASEAGGPPLPAPGPGEWATWSHDQKRAYMQRTVLPAEREVFARFEPARFRKLDCRTCHGRGASDGNFRMPNPDLPKLVGGAEGFGELAANEPQLLKFMQSVVVPETARLLGVPAFDMKAHVGFSCFQCHTRSDRE